MQARYADGSYVVTLTPSEAHALIWGGPEDVVNALNHDLRHVLVNVEDVALTEPEYDAAVEGVDLLPRVPSVFAKS